MKKTSFTKIFSYFSLGEKILWSFGVCLILIAFILFDRTNYMTLLASLIGVTSLIFNAKGNPVGQFLIILFSMIYGVISYSFSYYGEMITYLMMTTPMAILSLIAWLKNPFKGNKSEVAINRINKGEGICMIALTFFVTLLFYFILKFFHTANLLPGTLSVTTSFLAVFLTYKRDPRFALAYASNDFVLIILWSLASFEDLTYISVTVCFVIFLINDLYTFFNWKRMEKRQLANPA
ncbi:MAG: nicotinamide riboside transporter PnuC [Lachnospiraceae bacterium]|nr:nicotinamide riboside transporter PnuC [Lachnospiraceae bacterium]